MPLKHAKDADEFRKWVQKYLSPEADSSVVMGAVEEAIRDYPDYTVSEAIKAVEEARSEPWATISRGLDWNAINWDKTRIEEAMKSIEIVKEALEQGLISPKEAGLWRRLPPSPEKAAEWRKRVKGLEEQLERLRRIPKPKYPVGTKVYVQGLGECTVTDMELKDGMWEYTVTYKGKEYVARESEIKPLPEATKLGLTELDVEDLTRTLRRTLEGLPSRIVSSAVFEFTQELSALQKLPREKARQEAERILAYIVEKARKESLEAAPPTPPPTPTVTAPSPKAITSIYARMIPGTPFYVGQRVKARIDNVIKQGVIIGYTTVEGQTYIMVMIVTPGTPGGISYHVSPNDVAPE